MLLSIITPALNEERYIAETIESFIAQQCHSFDIEVLICDGMSTDRTREIVKEYAAIYPNVRLIDNPDRKTPYAFNVGLKEAKGEYIAILGAHAKFDANYIQVCYDELIKSGSVGCSGRIVTKSAFNTFPAKISEWVMLSTFGVSSSSYRTLKEGYSHTVSYPIFKKQPLIDLGGYNVLLERNQDNDMNQRLLDAGHKLYCTNKTMCYYRPPATLERLFQYAFKSGLWNAKSLFHHPKSMRIHHLVPFVFTSSIIVTAIFGLAEFLFFSTTYLWYLLAFIVCMHLLTGLLFTMRSLKYEHDSRKTILPFMFFAFHFSYGWGSVKGFWKSIFK
jgi:glycosyltransferase involved in cell wall biosynthesis